MPLAPLPKLGGRGLSSWSSGRSSGLGSLSTSNSRSNKRIRIIKVGASFNPPKLAVVYTDTKTNKKKKKVFDVPSGEMNAANLAKTMASKYPLYLSSDFIREQQLTAVLRKIVLSASATPAIDPNEDLNKVSEVELERKKKLMDIEFKKNQLKPGDPGYVHNVKEEFTPDKPSAWDDDDDDDEVFNDDMDGGGDDSIPDEFDFDDDFNDDGDDFDFDAPDNGSDVDDDAFADDFDGSFDGSF